MLGSHLQPYAILTGIVVGSAVALGLAKRDGINLREVVAVQALIALGGLFGAKAHAAWEVGRAFLSDGRLIGGWRYAGGILAAAVAVVGVSAIRGKLSLLARISDSVAPSIGVAMAIVRVGCFLDGCCHGSTTSMVWGVSWPRQTPPWLYHVSRGLILPNAVSTQPSHPLQLYFLAASLVAAGVAYHFLRQPHRAGTVFLAFMVVDHSLKALLETYRMPPEPHLQFSSAALAGICALLLPILWYPPPLTADLNNGGNNDNE